LPLQVDAVTKRIHTDYMHRGSNRLSSTNPNLQNIFVPNGDKKSEKHLLPDENYTIISADYSQIELRIIAALSGEENMIKAFLNNEDIHKSTASKVFDVPLEEVTREQKPCENG
jgi:DNA polymerase-1